MVRVVYTQNLTLPGEVEKLFPIDLRLKKKRKDTKEAFRQLYLIYKNKVDTTR